MTTNGYSCRFGRFFPARQNFIFRMSVVKCLQQLSAILFAIRFYEDSLQGAFGPFPIPLGNL